MAGPTDETRWREQGRSSAMTLEQRAEFIAGASHNLPGGPRWKMIRDRALEQLREVGGGRS